MPIKKFGEVCVELKDTENLQMQSLCGFMEALGYDYYNGHFESVSHLTPTDRAYIGLNTAQRWHNCGFGVVGSYWHAVPVPCELLEMLGFSKSNSLAIMSKDAKLVTKTKLQWSKKLHNVLVVDHQIEFV
jgi:hypothetical protein